MNKESLLITVTISLAATAKRKQPQSTPDNSNLQGNYKKVRVTGSRLYQTATGKPVVSAVMQSMSRQSSSRIWEEGEIFFHAVR